MELFLPILGDNSRKSHWNWQVWLQKSLSNLVRSFSDVESQKRCQPLTNAFGGMGWYAWNWLSHYNVNATISCNNENLNSLPESSPFMGNREKSQASGMQKETQKQGARKESGSSSFPLPSQLRHSHTCTFICHSKWRGCSQSYSVNQHKNSSYLRTKQCPLWLHVSFFNKKSSHTRGILASCSTL